MLRLLFCSVFWLTMGLLYRVLYSGVVLGLTMRSDGKEQRCCSAERPRLAISSFLDVTAVQAVSNLTVSSPRDGEGC